MQLIFLVLVMTRSRFVQAWSSWDSRLGLETSQLLKAIFSLDLGLERLIPECKPGFGSLDKIRLSLMHYHRQPRLSALAITQFRTHFHTTALLAWKLMYNKINQFFLVNVNLLKKVFILLIYFSTNWKFLDSYPVSNRVLSILHDWKAQLSIYTLKFSAKWE